MADIDSTHLIRAKSIEHAVRILSAPENKLVPLAGGTWLARQEIREGYLPDGYLVLTDLEELHGITFEDQISIGALCTHAEITAALSNSAKVSGLRTAAAKSANPGVRRIATIGGNIVATDFCSADLATALLAIDASLEIAGPHGTRNEKISSFLEQGGGLAENELLLRVIIERASQRSSHARLTIKAVGDYPVAILSASCLVSPSGEISECMIAVGSVQQRAFRWSALEQRLDGKPLDQTGIAELARESLAGMEGRDDVDASGEYRVKVLPELAVRAFADMQQQGLGGKHDH